MATTSTATYTLGLSAPFNEKASNAYGKFCFECGRKLGTKFYLMHVNTSWQLIAPYADDKDSQGSFPIGSTCKNKFADGVLIAYEG
jgi:hypothetical protein